MLKRTERIMSPLHHKRALLWKLNACAPHGLQVSAPSWRHVSLGIWLCLTLWFLLSVCLATVPLLYFTFSRRSTDSSFYFATSLLILYIYLFLKRPLRQTSCMTGNSFLLCRRGKRNTEQKRGGKSGSGAATFVSIGWEKRERVPPVDRAAPSATKGPTRASRWRLKQDGLAHIYVSCAKHCGSACRLATRSRDNTLHLSACLLRVRVHS